MIAASLIDGETFQHVKVTPKGELVTAPIEHTDPVFQSMTVNDQAYNFFINQIGFQIVITDIIAFGDRSVGTAGSAVVIYEATATDSTVATKTILQLDIGKNASFVATGLNYFMSQGVFINAKMDDNNVNLTIGGYRVKI